MSPLAQLAAYMVGYMVGAVLTRAVIAYVDARLDVPADDRRGADIAICSVLWPVFFVVLACATSAEYAKRAGANARKRARR